MHVFSGLSLFLVVLTLFGIFNIAIAAAGDISGKNNPNTAGWRHAKWARNLASLVEICTRCAVKDCTIPRRQFSTSCVSQVDDLKGKLSGINNPLCISFQPNTLISRGDDTCIVEDPVNPGVVFHLQGVFLHAAPERLPRHGELCIGFIRTIQAEESPLKALVVFVLLKESSIRAAFSRGLRNIIVNLSNLEPHRTTNDSFGQFSIASLLSIAQSNATYRVSATLSPCENLVKLQAARKEALTKDSYPLLSVRAWKIYHLVDFNPVMDSNTREQKSVDTVSLSRYHKKGTKGNIMEETNSRGSIGADKEDVRVCANRILTISPTSTHQRGGSRGRFALNNSPDKAPISSAVSSSKRKVSPFEENSLKNPSLRSWDNNPSSTLTESSTSKFRSIIPRVINYMKEHYARLLICLILALVFLAAIILAYKSRYRSRYIVRNIPNEERPLFSSPDAFRYGIF
ncbi:unnamed protein product [Phytomonas sp. Hart1]|nr:unnamed protein product [Phytomonas sp. Hart1]|eukprot:CCW68758.1 unnamed protein product [Phytomonas sp. isolate Hart1]